MIRKGVVFLILTSMVLHCACRMNFISYLYQQRHEIAYALGLIEEIPIALCHHDYDFDSGLTVQTHDDDDSTVPYAFSNARDIILIFERLTFHLTPRAELTATAHYTVVTNRRYCPPGFPVFHPPA